MKIINFTPVYTVNFDESVLTHTLTIQPKIEILWPRNITITHDFIWCFQYAGDIFTYNALHCGGCTVSPFHMTFTAHMVANFHFFIWHLPIMPLFYPLFFLLNFSFLSLFPCCVDSKAITLDLKVTRGGYLGVRGWVLIKWFDNNSNQEVPLTMVNGKCGWRYWMLLQPVGKPLNQRSSKTLLAMFENFLTFQIRVGTLVVMMIIGGHLLFIIIILRMFAILIMWMVITEWWCWWSEGQRRAVTAWESPSAGTRRKKKQDFERERASCEEQKNHIFGKHT